VLHFPATEDRQTTRLTIRFKTVLTVFGRVQRHADSPLFHLQHLTLPGLGRTDRDAHAKRTWQAISSLRYAAYHAVDHSISGKPVPILQTQNLGPRQITVSASPKYPSSTKSSRSVPKFFEAIDVSNDPIKPVVASQFLRQHLVLLHDRKVQVLVHHSDSAASARLSRLFTASV
jgi:hypothetical protein